MSRYYSHLSCSRCGVRTDTPSAYLCPQCGGILETNFAYDRAFVERLEAGRFRVEDLLPVSGACYPVLGQGNTPLIRALALSAELQSPLYLKCEYQNPSGSFKDRPVSCGIGKAVELGCRKVVVASSGNGAAAVAAFAARVGMEALIYVPSSTPEEKVKQAVLYGGRVVRVPGPYSDAYAKALAAGEEGGAYNLTTTFINPFTLDGDKVVAYELYRELGVPDAIYVPIGAGPLLVGILRGYEEIKALGLIDRLPKMVGVQAEGCSPIVRAFQRDAPVESDKAPATIAGGICDGLVGYEQDGDHVIRAVRRSQGVCVAVTDEEIRACQNKLAAREGVFVEPSSAAAVAAVERRPTGPAAGVAVAILTGHGLKDMGSVNIKRLEE